MLTDFEQGVICLVRSAVANKKADLPEKFDIEGICSVAKMHQTRVLMLCGALELGFDKKNPEIKRLLKGAYDEVLTNEKQLKKYQQLLVLFEKEGIDYMPLKGILLKDMYPQTEMRSMGDIDILVRPEQYDKIQEILRSMDFEFATESDHEYIWCTKDSVIVELHKHLIPSYNKDYYEYFGDGFSRAKKVGDYAYRMSPEDEFLYLFTHFAKHYRDGGIGIKHLADLWVYEKSVVIDADYVKTELEKLRLLKFYQNIKRVLSAWFEDGKFDEITELISKVVIESGAYGQRKRSVIAAALRKKVANTQRSRTGSFMVRLFLPYKYMCIKYPYLKKYPFLLPIAHIIRITDALINKRSKIAMHANDIKTASPENVEGYEKELLLVGLEFNA